MKRTVFILAVTTTLMAGIFFAGCQSSSQKQDTALAKEMASRHDLRVTKATPEEWKIFKSESEQKIRNNEILITELKVKMEKPGGIFDPLHVKKVANLEQQNNYIRARLEAFEKSQSNWDSFKRELSKDSDEIGKALKELTIDSKE